MGGIKWRHVWKNLISVRGINAEVKEFAWKLTQDMLPIGNRIHRNNVEKRCLNKLETGQCTEIPDIAHKMYNCPAVQYASGPTRLILEEFMEKKIEERAMYDIYNGLGFNKSQMLSLFF